MKKGEKLERLIKDKYIGWSISRFADYAGIKRTTLHDITKKESLDKIGIENIQSLAIALEMSIEELLFRLNNNIDYKEKVEFKIPESNKTYLENNESSTLNYLGNVSTGKIHLVESVEKGEQIKLREVSLGKHQNSDNVFIMKVDSESMNKILPVDSLIVCLPVNDISEIKHNDMVVFKYDNKIDVKQFKIIDENLVFSPHSMNEQLYDIVISKEAKNDVKIIAKVISYHVYLD